MSAASRPVTERRLHVAAEYHDRDLDAAEAAANAFLTALGIDVDHAALARTAQVSGATTVTSALHGLLLDDARARQEFVTLTHPAR